MEFNKFNSFMDIDRAFNYSNSVNYFIGYTKSSKEQSEGLLYKRNSTIGYKYIYKKIANALKKTIPIFIILIILRILLVKEVNQYLFKLFSENSEIFLIILGAVITITLSAFRNFFSIRRKKKKSKNRDGLMLLYDIKSIINKFSYMNATNELELIDFDKEWKIKYHSISDLLSYEHYECLNNTYYKLERYNAFVNKESYKEAKKILINILKNYKNDNILPKTGINLRDVEGDLHRISENKKAKSVRLYKVFEYVLFISFLKKNFKMIEDLLLEEVANNKSNDGALIDEKVLEKIKQNKTSSMLIKDERIKKAIFDVSMNSKKITRVWGDYYINEQK